MIKQLKILIKLLPSAYRFKLSLVGAAIMYLVGIVMALSFPGNGIGIVFLMMGPIWVSQLIISLSVSNLVQVSPFKKALHTYLSACLLYTSDAADDGYSVDLGGRRIIKKIFFKQKTAYEISEGLVGSEMCIRDRVT